MPESAYNRISVTPIAGAIGAELGNVRLSSRLDGALIEEVRAALLDHNVIFFRDQDLTPEEFLALAQMLGEPVEYPLLKGLPGFPVITPVIKREHERMNFGGVWHTDTAYLPEPPMATLLLARKVPPVGGDTLFANLTAAYEALSEGMKAMLSGLRAVNSSQKADATRTREDSQKAEGRSAPRPEFLSEHPVVRTHPETGRKALYVNVAHTLRFAGMTEEESAPLLRYLYEHSVRPEFTCRFAWREGSMAIWDNRCTLHNPVNDYHGYYREMHRITLKGATPV